MFGSVRKVIQRIERVFDQGVEILRFLRDLMARLDKLEDQLTRLQHRQDHHHEARSRQAEEQAANQAARLKRVEHHVEGLEREQTKTGTALVAFKQATDHQAQQAADESQQQRHQLTRLEEQQQAHRTQLTRVEEEQQAHRTQLTRVEEEQQAQRIEAEPPARPKAKAKAQPKPKPPTGADAEPLDPAP